MSEHILYIIILHSNYALHTDTETVCIFGLLNCLHFSDCCCREVEGTVVRDCFIEDTKSVITVMYMYPNLSNTGPGVVCGCAMSLNWLMHV